MVHGFQNDFTRHKILIDLEVRGFEVRGLSKVHLAAVLKALLYSPIITRLDLLDYVNQFGCGSLRRAETAVGADLAKTLLFGRLVHNGMIKWQKW